MAAETADNDLDGFVKVVAQIKILRSALDGAQQRQIAKKLTRHTFEAGETIVSSGDEAGDALYYIEAGVAAASPGSPGRGGRCHDKTRGEPYDVNRNHMVPPLVLSACYLMPLMR
eukprot:SAG22_NODE_2535_length_2467_cov_1.691723_3_plen_114_part_01